jgi:DNA mismatch repair protein MSH6
MQTNVRELLLEKREATTRTRTVARQHVNTRLTHFVAPFLTPGECEAVLAQHFQGAQRPAPLTALDDAAASALGTMLQFLRGAGEGKIDEQVLGARDFRPLQVERGGDQLFVDGAALRHLGVLPPPADPTATHGTLLGFVDRCLSPFGRRTLRQWLAHPLRAIGAIEARLDAVDELMAATAVAGDGEAVQALRALLARLPDLERRVAALASGRLSAGEFVALIDAMESTVEQLTRRESAGFRAALLRANVAAAVDGLGAVVARASALFDRASAGKGASANVVPLRGADAAFDACRDALTACEAALESHLGEQREALGSRALKYWHPKGKTANMYQIEVPSKISVPGNWEKKSSKAGTDRYHSPFIVAQLPELERLNTEHDALVASTLARVQRACVADFATLRSAVRALAELDVLQAFARATADATVSGPMCRPRFEDEAARGGAALFRCRALRHPCLPDATLTTGAPVPNDVCLDGAADSSHAPLALLTGANMGGKTTLLRQVCLAVLLAQCGCYVPAVECQLTPVDAVLTRLGASDNILAGQSTFMVELLETGTILRHATPASLVILDELGRGTSTHDGLAIAYAVIDALAARRCRTLFATHYHLLTATYAGRPHDVALWSMRVALERGSDGAVGRIVPLYQMAIGAALNSFGAECALMAGVPEAVVERAAVIAQEGDRLGRDRFVVDTVHTLATLLDQPDSAANATALKQIGAQVRHLTQGQQQQ